MNPGLYRPAGSATGNGYVVDISPESAGWDFCGIRVVDLPPAGAMSTSTGEDEVIVLPLAGSCTVEADGQDVRLAGRESVFTGVTDYAYVPRDASLRVASQHGGRFALASARARNRLPFRYVSAKEVPVELRGAGPASRQVNNFGTPQVLDADRVIACEVLTPGGNWSSFPPHKHDEDRPGESVLEEIYYFEVRGAGMAYQRVYGTAQRPVDLLAEVRTGDVVLIPHGWHGPSMAVPGYDLYYLNVMAGPGERSWLIRDDPAHAWVRGTWADQPIDPRLPLTEVPST
jgi:5-deoxy-glucuronate isomerase